MLKIYFKTAPDEKLKEINEVRKGCWLDIQQADHKDFVKIAELTKLDIPDLDDVLDQYEMPRIERHKEGVIIFLRYPVANQPTPTASLTLVITPEYLITISAQTHTFLPAIFSQKPAIGTTQKSKFMLAVLKAISDTYTRNVHAITASVAKQGKKITDVQAADINATLEFESILNHYLAVLVPLKGVYEQITSGKYVSLYEDDSDLLEDLVISINQSVDICKVSLKNLQSIRDASQIVFTNSLNRTIKFLTAFTIIMTIPTTIASFYGMNVMLPFAENPFAFLMVVCGAFLLCLVLLAVFAWKKWL